MNDAQIEIFNKQYTRLRLLNDSLRAKNRDLRTAVDKLYKACLSAQAVLLQENFIDEKQRQALNKLASAIIRARALEVDHA